MAKTVSKAVDRRIERAFGRGCTNAQVLMTDLGKVFAVGRKAIDEGADDAALEAAIVAFVNTIRLN